MKILQARFGKHKAGRPGPSNNGRLAEAMRAARVRKVSELSAWPTQPNIPTVPKRPTERNRHHAH
jgi:hypothetical protein